MKVKSLECQQLNSLLSPLRLGHHTHRFLLACKNYILFHWFFFQLASTVEPGSLKDYIFANLKIFGCNSFVLFFLSVVGVWTSSSSSPILYRRVLTCLVSASADYPDAIINCSNLLCHFSHSSGFLKLKGSGGLKCIVPAIPLLSPCSVNA